MIATAPLRTLSADYVANMLFIYSSCSTSMTSFAFRIELGGHHVNRDCATVHKPFSIRQRMQSTGIGKVTYFRPTTPGRRRRFAQTQPVADRSASAAEFG